MPNACLDAFIIEEMEQKENQGQEGLYRPSLPDEKEPPKNEVPREKDEGKGVVITIDL